MRRGPRAVAFIAIAGAAACSLGVGDGFTGGAEPAEAGSADASSEDAGAGTEAAPLPEPSALVNGDFELGCAGWDATGVDVSDSTVTHSGKSACRLCSNAAYGQLIAGAHQAASAGERWVAEIWVRADPTMPSPASSSVDVATLENNQYSEQAPYGGGAVTPVWTKLTALLVVTKAAADVIISFRMDENVGRCVLVDDARLYKAK